MPRAELDRRYINFNYHHHHHHHYNNYEKQEWWLSEVELRLRNIWPHMWRGGGKRDSQGGGKREKKGKSTQAFMHSKRTQHTSLSSHTFLSKFWSEIQTEMYLFEVLQRLKKSRWASDQRVVSRPFFAYCPLCVNKPWQPSVTHPERGLDVICLDLSRDWCGRLTSQDLFGLRKHTNCKERRYVSYIISTIVPDLG